MSEAVPCWLVIHYRTFQLRWLRAICTTPEEADLRKRAVEQLIDSELGGCEHGDKVFVEEALLNHLYGKEMHF